MKRGGSLRRSKALNRAALPDYREKPDKPSASRSAPPKRKQKQTGPSAEVRALVIARASGRCEACGTPAHGIPYSIHHRQPRGMGGTSDPAANSPTNLLLLCGSGTTGCHGWVESNRVEAAQRGLLVPRPDNPGLVPVLLHDSRSVTLDSLGGYNRG